MKNVLFEMNERIYTYIYNALLYQSWNKVKSQKTARDQERSPHSYCDHSAY